MNRCGTPLKLGGVPERKQGRGGSFLEPPASSPRDGRRASNSPIPSLADGVRYNRGQEETNAARAAYKTGGHNNREDDPQSRKCRVNRGTISPALSRQSRFAHGAHSPERVDPHVACGIKEWLARGHPVFPSDGVGTQGRHWYRFRSVLRLSVAEQRHPWSRRILGSKGAAWRF